MLSSDEMRAWYGPDDVRLAADRGAIGTLLISDELFRSVTILTETHDHFPNAGTEQAIPKRGKNM